MCTMVNYSLVHIYFQTLPRNFINDYFQISWLGKQSELATDN